MVNASSRLMEKSDFGSIFFPYMFNTFMSFVMLQSSSEIVLSFPHSESKNITCYINIS